MDKEPQSVNIEELTAVQSLDGIYNLVNKAASKGVFTIDESYVLKVLFNKVLKELKKE
mgnify:CR=1 FL=1